MRIDIGDNKPTFILHGVLMKACFMLLPLFSYSQETNSSASGIIKTERNENLGGAVITLVHEPTKNTFITISQPDGHFNFANLKPGGPYTISISFTGYESCNMTDLFLDYNSSGYFIELPNKEIDEYTLHEKYKPLPEVIIKNKNLPRGQKGIETSIHSQEIAVLPSISRNLQDYVRLVPQSKVNSDGMMSLAGQNNKMNAFFIDGANNNDLLGVALNGINGGQTGTPPLPIEAIEEIKVLLSPYDVQYSNFTGGSINVITRSGSNDVKGAAWYYFRNEKLAGRSPEPLAKPGNPPVFERTKLSPFFNQTLGSWVSGPVIKNKLFYFISAEEQIENNPRPFNFSEYLGTSSEQQVNALADTLRIKYKYDPGSFLETQQEINATRAIIKMDWNPSTRNKFTASYRFNYAEKISPRQSGGTRIVFQNNAGKLPATTHNASFEWKYFFRKGYSNRLLFTFSDLKVDNQWLGAPFPQVVITDGPASIFFGSNGVSQLTLNKTRDLTLLDVFKLTAAKNNLSFGAEFNTAYLYDLIVPAYFGDYRYKSLNDFLTDQYAARYDRSFPLDDKPRNDNTTSAAEYHSRRLGLFVNDDIEVNSVLKLNCGLRLDGNALPDSYPADQFFNDTAAAILNRYYPLEGAVSGKPMKTSWLLAPRVGFTFKIPDEKITVRGGAGIFSGHILNIWASGIYNSSLGNIDVNPRVYGLHFNGDPYNQPDYQSLSFNSTVSKGGITVVANNFKYPAVFRSSLGIDKKYGKGWIFSTELLFTKNISEWKITNISLLPPDHVSAPPDSRSIYSITGNVQQIPLYPNGINPYTQILLLTNNHDKRGFAYSFSFQGNKSFNANADISFGYVYGNSYALFEPYSTAGPLNEQWASSETVNGKNLTQRSVSDLDAGHRVYVNLYKKFDYGKQKFSTAITLFYNGQSGQRYSYVYSNSIISDDGRTNNSDLIYIPTQSDLETMKFLANTANGVIYTPDEQRKLLDNFIEGDVYLRRHRGQFAERNGARLPFTHLLDLRLQQDIKIKTGKRISVVSIIYDVFNFTNMLNKNWGRIYVMPSDNYQLIQFVSFNNANELISQYKFSPPPGKPYSVQNTSDPGGSARWISQLGVKLSF